MSEDAKSEEFEPNIVAFLCNWCSYAGADLAGTSRMHYLPNVRIIRVMCSGRVNPLFLVNALQQGADGVLISGCHPGDCHYLEGNYYARRRFMPVSYTHLRAHETRHDLVCRLLLEKKKKKTEKRVKQ